MSIEFTKIPKNNREDLPGKVVRAIAESYDGEILVFVFEDGTTYTIATRSDNDASYIYEKMLNWSNLLYGFDEESVLSLGLFPEEAVREAFSAKRTREEARKKEERQRQFEVLSREFGGQQNGGD